MARLKKYDASPDTLYVPVSAEEIDAYLEGKGRMLLGRNPVKHFLYRTRVTISTHERSIKSLQKTIHETSEASVRSRSSGGAVLNPVEALRYASTEEIAQVVGHLNKQQIQALARHVSAARGVQQALVADLTRVRGAVTAIINNNNLDADARAQFVRLLNELPAMPDAVTTPSVLELAQATGMVERDENEPEGLLGLPGDENELNTPMREVTTLHYYNTQPTPSRSQ